jgi:NAD(P)H-flavin reductase
MNRPISPSAAPLSPGGSPWRPISRSEIERFARALSSAYEVVGVQRLRGRLTLERLDDPAELLLEFPPRVHSPKKYLFPHWEKLFRFRLGGRVLLEAEKAAAPRVIFGMHPCDLHAVRVLDDCLFEGEADSAYRAKREATVLIGVDCVPDEHCFCTSMGTDRVAGGFDLFLHRVDGGYLAQTGSERGEALLFRYLPQVANRPGEPPLPLQVKQTESALRFSVDSLAPLLEGVYDHPLWGDLGEKCLGCGACTLLCPSCYCFNVQDRLDLDLEGGERLRTWDSCQLDQFSKVAGGGDFRADQADRQRHRFFRKYKYLWEKHQRTACVGCGRCSRECLSRIDPPSVLNRLFAAEALPEVPSTPGGEYHPQLAEVVAVETLTEGEKGLRLRLDAPLAFAPGAFMEVSVFGLGEAPFTIASPPDGTCEIDLVVRAAGALTRALQRLKPGDTVGVRGPFGSGYPVDRFLGRDVLLVAGGLGLVTLRSLLLTILSRRDEFGRILLLCGARTPETFLFRHDLLRWHRDGILDCRFTVSDGTNAWSGAVGDVTVLLRDLDLAPQRTTAAVSGPPGMYRFVNPLLLRLGIAEEAIYLNLERHMKCGLGKCGKCRINDICVCECGPIFSYDRVRHLREAIER